MFIAVVDAILKVQVPGVNRDPGTVEAHESNMQALLDFLAEVIGTDLSHINHQNICQGKVTDVSNMLEIVMRLADIVHGSLEDGGCEDGEVVSGYSNRPHVDSAGIMEGREGGDESCESEMKPHGLGRHLAQRAWQRRAAPRGGDMTVDRFIRQQVQDTMAQLAQRERALAATAASAAPSFVLKSDAPQNALYRKAGAAGVTVKSKPRLAGGLGMPGYLRPTESALAAARKVDNLTCWGTGWPPSPRLARPRPDTGPPIPNPWQPLPLARGRDAAQGDDEVEMDEGGWMLVGGSHFAQGCRTTAASEAKRQRAVQRSASHRARREKHQRRQLEQELRRMHESAWLHASQEITQAVRQRVAYSKHLQRQATVLEQARSKAQERQRTAHFAAQKAALETFAADQAAQARETIRSRTYQVLASDKAAALACAEMQRETDTLARQWAEEAMEEMRGRFRHQTMVARSSLWAQAA